MTTLAPPVDPETSSHVDLTFGSPMRQNRATLFFRGILVIPQIIVLYFVALAASVLLIVGWFAALFTGRLPKGIAEFLRGYLRWTLRVNAYMYLLTDKYPPFSLQPSEAYPVDLEVRTGRLNRWAVLLRYFLAIPGSIAVMVLSLGMGLFAIVNWIVTLVKGEQPRMFFEAYAAGLRFSIRLSGYLFMLTSFYPSGLMGDSKPPIGSPESPTQAQEPSPLAEPRSGAGELAADLEATASSASAPGAPSALAHPEHSFPQTGPVVGSHLAVRRWVLVLSAGARKLVVGFLMLGLVGIVAYSVMFALLSNGVSTSLQALTTQNQAVSAYNTAYRATQSASSAATACTQAGPSAADQVKCLEVNDAKMAAAFNTYANALSTINFPASVASQASAAQAAAAQAGTTLEQLAAAGADAQAYQAAVTSSNLQSVLTQVDSTFNRLNSALISQ